MKKYFSFAALLSVVAFVGCEDVPAPYEIFDPSNSGGQGGSTDSIVAEGDGSLESPYNIAGIIEFTSALEANVNSESAVYFKGVASQIKEISTSYNNCTFYLSDDGSTAKQFYVYRCKGIDGGNVTSETLVELGDTVVVYGKVVNYSGNTPETVQKEAQLVSVNKKDGSTVGGGGNGGGQTSFEHLTIADFISKADQNTPYEITGVASRLNSGYSSLDLTEDGATVYVYKMVDASGATVSFATLNIAEGDTVTVTGKYYPYEKNGVITHELNPGTYVSHKKASGSINPPTPEPADSISIAEFLSKADTETTYRLSGTVKNIANTTYGNFDLVDGDASIYIYGLLDKNGAARNFASLNIKEGDVLTLEGKYVDYNGKAEIKDAQYINHISNGDPNPKPDPDPDPDPVNSITNGDFESWEGNVPTGWKPACNAGNATLSQSTDAHGGNYSVKMAANSANKRLAYQETTFEAGTYNVKFYAKSLGGCSSSYGPQTKAGYVAILADGSADSQNYQYASSYTNLSETDWTEVTYTFTLTETKTICLVVMNPKNGGDIVVDDYTITKQ